MFRFLHTLRPQLIEHRVLISLLVYAFGQFLYTAVSTTIGNAVQLVGALYFIVTCLSESNKGIKTRPVPKFLLGFVAFWTAMLVVRMFLVDANLIIDLPLQKAMMAFFLGYRVWPIFLIFIPYVLGHRQDVDMGYYVRISVVMAIVFLILYPFAFHNMVNFQFVMFGAEGENYQDFISSSTLGVRALCPCMIILFWKRYIPQKMWLIVLLACIGDLVMTMYMARRGSTVLAMIYFLLLWYLYTVRSGSRQWAKQIVIVGMLIYMVYIVFTNLADSFFSLLVERGTEDTRGGVEYSFYKHFNSTTDWIFGRGLLGTYYDQIFREYRSSIETGYLFITLRGGLLYLIPYVLLLVISGIRGYFKSRSIFIKSVAIFMLMSILELYPWGYPTFSFKFFIIWLGIYICNSRYFLELSDAEVQNVFFRNLKNRL